MQKTDSYESNESENILITLVMNPIMRKVSLVNQDSESPFEPVVRKKSSEATPYFPNNPPQNKSEEKH